MASETTLTTGKSFLMRKSEKKSILKKNACFKVVFEEELDLTNVPETLKDELKQVHRSGKLIMSMNSIICF